MNKSVKIINKLNITENTTNKEVYNFILHEDDHVLDCVRCNNNKWYADIDINKDFDRMINLYNESDNYNNYDSFSLSSIKSLEIVQAGSKYYLQVNIKLD